MGSDKSYKYSGTMPKSQHYAKAYHVTPEMREYDKQRGVYNGIYELNPTAQNITKNGNSEFVISKNANDWYTYVVRLNVDITQHLWVAQIHRYRLPERKRGFFQITSNNIP